MRRTAVTGARCLAATWKPSIGLSGVAAAARGAQARTPVAVAQTANLELRGGREFGQPQVAPDQLVLIERHVEAAERQLVDPGT